MFNMEQTIDPMKIHDSIEALNKFITDNSITQLISALEDLEKEPGNASLLAKVSAALNDIGVMKGAVLTYAPYVWLMLSEDPFDD